MKPKSLVVAWFAPRPALISLLLLLIGGSTAIAQESPEFSRLLVFEKWKFGMVHGDADGGALFTAMIFTTNQQTVGTNSFSGRRPLVIGRLNRYRDLEWHVTVATTTTSPFPLAVTRDSSSNVLCLGMAYYPTNQTGILSVLGQPILLSTAVSGEAFLIKLDSGGGFQWARPAGWVYGSLGISGGLATDSSNAVLVVQDFTRGVTTSCLLKKFAADGTLLWNLLTSSGTAIGTSVTVASDDDVFLTGVYKSSFTLQGISLTNATGITATFVARLDSNGQLRWIVGSGARQYASILGAVLDSGTNLVVCGVTSETNFFGLANNRGARPSGYSSEFPSHGFVGNFSPAGQALWVQAVRDGFPPGNSTPPSSSSFVTVALDARGGIYVGGGFGEGAITLGADTLVSVGRSDALIAKLDADGNVLWTRRGGANRVDGFLDTARSLTVTQDGVLVAGEFSASEATFGSLSASTGQPPVPHGGEPAGFFTLIPHPAPPMATELAGAELKVSWPTFPPEFALETATALGAPTLWSSNSVPVSTSNGTHSVTFPVDGPARYFRLRKPIP